MSIDYPQSSGECYVDREDLGLPEDLDADLLLDADTAANFIAGVISDFTHEEVDGDGDAWGIVCDHLHALLHNLHDALTTHDHGTSDGMPPRFVDWINHEYGYSIGRS